MYFLDKFKNAIEKKPDETALILSNGSKGMTYAQLDDFSGRIYRYLKSSGIGKEDMVLICLPRDVRVAVSLIGILKAGAAFCVVESTYAPERISYIKNDTNARLIIDDETYSRMMSCAYLDGFEKRDVHDACFAIYTSGSTGNPKGVLHEYGKIDEILESSIVPSEERGDFAVISPLSFVAALKALMTNMIDGVCVHIVSYDIVKNPEAFVKYIEDNDITYIFATPSFLKVLPRIPKTLKHASVGGEIISGIYIEGLNIINSYSSSEVATTITKFLIDREYDNTPVGKPCNEKKVFILDENGSEVPQGGQGEVCVEISCTRGYINLPDKTDEVFINGLYHTGDIGYKDENGNLIICGRKDDMIKINGNRIEPAEIESAVKKILKINGCAAKGFADDERSFIAVYMLKGELEKNGLLDEEGRLSCNLEKLRGELLRYLPYYMIPTYFEVMDAFPKNDNGKLLRKALAKPSNTDITGSFTQPEGEEEIYFCSLFSEILNLKKVSADGDFYTLGGDSMRAMKFISKCRYDEISISDIYSFRTPKRLAKRLLELKSMDLGSSDERNIKALEHLQPLLSEAQWVLDNQLFTPKGTMWTLTIFDRLNDNVDISRLKAAVDRVLSSHPAMCTHLVFDDDSNVMMKYSPDFFKETEIIEIGEDELMENKEALSSYYTLIDEVLYKSRIYITEKSTYIFLDFHHIITDGTSLKIIGEQIKKAYEDESFVPETDYFYLIARNAVKMESSKEYYEIGRELIEEAGMVFEKDKKRPVSFIKEDMPYKAGSKLSAGEIIKDLDVSKKDLGEDSPYFKYGGNALFMYAFLKTQAQYNGSDCAYTCWTHNGRDDALSMNANGLLYRTYPMYADFSSFSSDEEGVKYIRERIDLEIARRYSGFVFDNNERLMRTTSFLYQSDLYINLLGDELVKEVFLLEKDKDADAHIEFMVLDNSDSDTIKVKLRFVESEYRSDSIDKFLEMFEDNVREIIFTL